MGSQSQIGLDWLKNQLIKEFDLKNFDKAKTVIEWEIIRDLQAKSLKINQKGYIWDLLEAEKMNSYYPTIFSMKVESMFSFDQVVDYFKADQIIY